MDLNVVTLVGRAGRDPEMKYVGSGENYRPVCSLTLAVDRLKRKGDMNEPDWFNLEIWGKTAEIAGQYVKKGSLIGVTGNLIFNRWQDKLSGEAKERPLIRVDRLDLLGSRRDSGADAPDFGDGGDF
ncbi:single-stranded DNA-binding protein [Anthocerotibacter panamensis]|uniref:single-stranded DNA-binding protein n=1 Tax=Anthocerotibacter panamensis TaxID=2857077 RepID=UPI001C405EF1|nr:single-stranded DNA-binding protein [Anthocerotibacter panamensis]